MANGACPASAADVSHFVIRSSSMDDVLLIGNFGSVCSKLPILFVILPLSSVGYWGQSCGTLVQIYSTSTNIPSS